MRDISNWTPGPTGHIQELSKATLGMKIGAPVFRLRPRKKWHFSPEADTRGHPGSRAAHWVPRLGHKETSNPPAPLGQTFRQFTHPSLARVSGRSGHFQFPGFFPAAEKKSGKKIFPDRAESRYRYVKSNSKHFLPGATFRSEAV